MLNNRDLRTNPTISRLDMDHMTVKTIIINSSEGVIYIAVDSIDSIMNIVEVSTPESS
jgi:hypothetical protein